MEGLLSTGPTPSSFRTLGCYKHPQGGSLKLDPVFKTCKIFILNATLSQHCTLAKVGKGGYISELLFHHIFVSLRLIYKIFIRASSEAKSLSKFASEIWLKYDKL